MRRARVRARRLGLAAALAGIPGVAAAAGPTLAECDAGLVEDASAREAWGCYYDAARGGVEFELAEARLRAAMERHPSEHGYDQLTLANLVGPRDPEASVALYEAALARFRAREDHLPQVLTNLNLAHRYRVRGTVDDAEAALVEAEQAAELHGEPRWIATVKSERVRHLLRTGGDLGTARRLLIEVEPLLFPDGDYQAQLNWLNSAGMVHHGLGRMTEGEVYYARLIALTQANEDRYAESNARYNKVVRTLSRMARAGKSGDGDPVIVAELAAIEALAEQGGNQAIVISAACLRGELLDSEPILRECLADAREFGDERIVVDGIIGLAFAIADPDAPERLAEAFALLDEAKTLAERAEDLFQVARAYEREAELRWWVGSSDEAIVAAEAALAKIEALRANQQDPQARVELKAQWSDAYERTIGHLLGGGRRAQPGRVVGDDELARAYATVERMRAQELREVLDEAGLTARARAKLRDRPEYAATLAELSATQVRLGDPGLSGAERKAAIAELEALERRERAMQAEARDASGSDPSAALGSEISIAPLDAVQAVLEPDEALLVYQLANGGGRPRDFDGGAWVLVVTRDHIAAHRLADERELIGRVELFGPLLARRDGSDGPASVQLWTALLADAVVGLPESITRLTLVPDGALHRLPFAALRPAVDAQSLAERYALDFVPSATSLVHWRAQRERSGTPELPPAVLALADPVVEHEPARLYASALEPNERGGSLLEGLELATLPRARLEAERAVAGGGELRLGEDAGEAALRELDLSAYGVVHFATHALVDELHPGRSAIVLARDQAEQDGLLQPREIVELELDGKLVVLSACSSASGAVVDGEGVMGLAHAMFEAGAHTVVGSLWPIRDDDALALFDRFYAHLDAGLPVAEALAAAQRDRIAAGAPPAAWAGVVVLGDGSLRRAPVAASAAGPLPDSHTTSPSGPSWWLLGLIGLAGLGLLGLVDRRNRRRT